MRVIATLAVTLLVLSACSSGGRKTPDPSLIPPASEPAAASPEPRESSSPSSTKSPATPELENAIELTVHDIAYAVSVEEWLASRESDCTQAEGIVSIAYRESRGPTEGAGQVRDIELKIFDTEPSLTPEGTELFSLVVQLNTQDNAVVVDPSNGLGGGVAHITEEGQVRIVGDSAEMAPVQLVIYCGDLQHLK